MGSKIREALFRRAACFLSAVCVVWPTRVATVVKPSPEMLSCLKKCQVLLIVGREATRDQALVAGHMSVLQRGVVVRVSCLSRLPCLLALQAQDKAIRRELRLPHAWRQQEGVQDRAQREDARGEGELGSVSVRHRCNFFQVTFFFNAMRPATSVCSLSSAYSLQCQGPRNRVLVMVASFCFGGRKNDCIHQSLGRKRHESIVGCSNRTSRPMIKNRSDF